MTARALLASFVTAALLVSAPLLAQYVGGGNIGGGGGSTGMTQAEADARYLNVSGDTMEGQLIVLSGLAGTPGISFTGDSGFNSGLYYDVATTAVRISNNSATNVFFQPSATVFNTDPVYFPPGSAANPSISFSNQTDAGFFRASSNTLALAIANVQVWDWDTAGARMQQHTSGTMTSFRVPTGIATTIPTKPTCSASANAAQIIFVDDSNDGAPGELCVCRAGADDSTYAWVKVADNSTGCL